MATYTEFYCDPVNGSNLNSGSDAGSPSMSDTAGTGSWTSTTNVYVSVATNGSVAVGQFISIYQTGATAPAYIARITSVSGGGGSPWTITVSTTAVAGTKPTTGSTFLAQVGGAWAGPTGTIGHPFNFMKVGTTDAAGDVVRVNLKNNATYSITAGIVINANNGPVIFQGYSTSPGDGGKAILDGGTSGASYILLSASTQMYDFADIIFQNNGATGSSELVFSNGSACTWTRCVFSNSRGYGFENANNTAFVKYCESFACNASNSSQQGGFFSNVNGTTFLGCISHDHTAGANCHGFILDSSVAMVDCVGESNAGNGAIINASGTSNVLILSSSFYNNSLSGIDGVTAGCRAVVQDCIFDSNGAYGINASGGGVVVMHSRNNAFYNNTSGQFGPNYSGNTINTITLTGSPFNAPSTGDFTLNSTAGAGASCKNAGFGTFTQTASSYTGSVSYPDVGAMQANITTPPVGRVTGARSIGTY